MTSASDSTRRQFLKTSALAAAALPPLLEAAGEPAPAPAPARKRKIKKGLMLGAVPGSMSVMEKFKLVKAAGFDGVEVDSGRYRDDVLRARDATGLEIATVVDSVHWNKNLAEIGRASCRERVSPYV